MSSTDKLTDGPPSANRAIDLSETCNLYDKHKSIEEVQLNTPYRLSLSTVRNGLRDAVRAASFLSMYSDTDIKESHESTSSTQ